MPKLNDCCWSLPSFCLLSNEIDTSAFFLGWNATPLMLLSALSNTCDAIDTTTKKTSAIRDALQFAVRGGEDSSSLCLPFKIHSMQIHAMKVWTSVANLQIDRILLLFICSKSITHQDSGNSLFNYKNIIQKIHYNFSPNGNFLFGSLAHNQRRF